MRILMCPGQGSQSEGFLKDWFENVPGFEQKVRELGLAANKDLVSLGTTAAEEEIKATENAQPLIVAASIAAARCAVDLDQIDGVVGHSVGEFAAAALAGVMTDEEAMQLVSVRANAMAEAAKLESTSMAAILGGEEVQVLAALEALGLSAANYNGAGQIVAAGSKESINSLVANPPEKARVIELKVAGALAGLAKRGMPNSTAIALKTSADLEKIGAQ